MDVDVVYDALRCVEALHTRRPDVLVLDAHLLWGGSDGVVACLREDRQKISPPVVLLLRESWHCEPARCPVVATLPDPVQPEMLLDVLQLELFGNGPRT